MCLMFAHFGHDMGIQPCMFRWHRSWAAARNQTVSLHQSLDGTWYFSRRICIKSHGFYALLNDIHTSYGIPAFFLFLVHTIYMTLLFIVQWGTAVASKYAAFQLGRCRLDEFFGLRRCPLVAVDGASWICVLKMWGIGVLPLNRWWRGFDISALWPTNNYHAWRCTIWSHLMMPKTKRHAW